MTDRTDAQLVEASRRGDVDSFGELYDRYYAAAVGIAFCVTCDRYLAEDAAQEAFAVACRDLFSLRNPERFASWLGTICRRAARRAVKSKWRHRLPENVELVTGENPGDERRDLVRQSVRRLPRSAREVVVLHYFSDLSYEQIATTLNISPQAVHGRLIRARRKVASYLQRNGLGRSTP